MLATTAGGFLYISTVGILPLVLREKSSILQIFLESFGFLLGVGFMVAVAILEEIDE
jgi:zinc transporter ZupT